MVDPSLGTGVEQETTGIVVTDNTSCPYREFRIKTSKVNRHVMGWASSLELTSSNLR
jgi:hypothetical protein